MKKFKSKGKDNYLNLSRMLGFTFILIMLFTFFLMKKFNKEINNNIINISEAEVNKVTYNFVNERINHNIINKNTINDILLITKNKNDEILYVDFNLDNAYQILDVVADTLIKALKDMEQGNIDITYYDKDISNKTNSLVLNIPIGTILKSNYFYNLGPKIPVKVNYVGAVLTNLKTNITNYGLNNALVEVVVNIEFHNTLLTYKNSKDLSFKYDVIIASMMIEGSVPSFYNGSITKESEVYTENF